MPVSSVCRLQIVKLGSLFVIRRNLLGSKCASFGFSFVVCYLHSRSFKIGLEKLTERFNTYPYTVAVVYLKTSQDLATKISTNLHFILNRRDRALCVPNVMRFCSFQVLRLQIHKLLLHGTQSQPHKLWKKAILPHLDVQRRMVEKL